MPLNSYTGRQDPSARYEPKAPKEKRFQSYRDFDLSTLEDLSLETEGEDFTVPNQPDPVTPTMPAVQAASVPPPSENAQFQQTEMERINNLGDALLEEEDSQFTMGAIAGTQQMLGLYGAAKATLGSLVDDQEMVNSGLGYYQEKMREAEKFSPNVGTLEEIDLTLDGGMERLGDYLGYTIGNVLPSIAISLGTGGVTGIVAGTAAKYLGKEGAKEALEALAKKQIKDETTLGSEGLSNALKKLRLKDRDFDTAENDRLQELIREDMEGAIAKEAANRAKQDYISKQAYKYGLVGSGSQSVTLNTGENFGEIYERTGVQAPGTAIAAGITAGALDTFAVPLRVAKQLTPDMLEPLKDFLSAEALQKSGAIERVLKEVGKTSGIEGMTEATQVMITEMAVTFANNNFTDQQKIEYLEALSNEETRSKVMNAAAAGLIGGFAVSGVTAPIGEGVSALRGREPEPSIRDALIQDTENRLQAMRDSVREVVDAEFTESSNQALPAPEASDTQELVGNQEVATTQQPSVDSNIVDNLETIDLSAGITSEELAEAMMETPENQQQLITAMLADGLITADSTGGTTTYSVSNKGSMILYPPEEVDEGLVDLPPVPSPVASTTTVETDGSTTTTTQTLDEIREDAVAVSEETPQTGVAETTPTRTRAEPTMSSRIEGRGTISTNEPVVSPLIGPVDNKPLNDRGPFVSPLTDENRVIAKPTVKNTLNGIGIPVTEVSFPDSGTTYQMKEYAADAGGGWYLASEGLPELGVGSNGRLNVDLGDNKGSAVQTLAGIERQRASTAVQTPVAEEALVEGVAEPVADAAPIVEDPIQRNAETLTAMAEYAGWEIIGGKGIVGPEGESLGRSPWVARSEWFQQAQKDGNLGGNTNGEATRRVVAKAIAGKKLGVVEQRHIDSMLGYLADLELIEQSQQSSVIADLSQEGAGVTVTELEYDDALAGITLGDTNRLELPVWGEMTDSEKDAELNNIFGEPDGRETNATQREAEARTAISDRRQNATNERELAAVREGDVTEDTGRESGQTESRVSQPDANPKQKRNLDNPDTETDLTFPDGDVRTIRKDGEFWYDAETDLELGDNKREAVQAIKDIRQEEFAASGGSVQEAPATQELRVKDPSLDANKSTKKDKDFQQNGEHIVSFSDGDERRMFYDAQSRSWYDREALGTAAKGMDGYLGGNKKDALERFKVIRQREFDEQQATDPSDQMIIEVAGIDAFPGIPIGANRASGSITGSGMIEGEPNPTIAQRITAMNLMKDQQVQMGQTGDSFTQKAFGSMSMLYRNLASSGKYGSDRNPFVVVESDDGRQVPLMPLLDEYSGDLTDSLDSSSEVAQFVHVLLDLVEKGMPVDFVTNTNGIFVNDYNRSVAGSFYPSRFSISVRQSLLESATTDLPARARLMHVVAHEHWHLADELNGYSARLPELRIDIDSSGGFVDPDDAVVSLDFADPVGRLYEEWARGTELGKEFHYPFAIIGNTLTDINEKYPDQPSQMSESLRTFEKEVFAQAGAVFITKPDLLKNVSPEIYNLFRLIQAEPLKTAGQLINDENKRTPKENREPSGSSVPSEFRSRTSNRVVQIPLNRGSGPDSSRGGSGGRASPTMERSTSDQNRDASGRSLQVTPSLDVRFEDLPEASQRLTASPVLYGDQAPSQVEGKPTVVKVAREFDNIASAAYPRRDLSEQTDENSEIISDLIAHEATEALNKEGNAGQWYQEKVANAMSLAAERFPELNNDPNAKFAFTAIMAITSNGADVPGNSVNTFTIYDQYRESKIFPDFGAGKESQAMKAAFMQLNDLISASRIDSVREFMDQDVTVKELKNDYGLKVSGELMGTKLKGSAILGPKIGGGFYQNLNGNFDPLTMDRWFMRTYGRLTGSLMSEATRKLPAQIAKFREVALSDSYKKKLKDDGISRVQLRNDDDYLVDYATRVQLAYSNGGFKIKSTINKASNTLKNSQGEKQAPQNGNEREYIRSVMQKALDKVNLNFPEDPINMGALQAIIWYPEKELYKLHGVGNAKSEPTDYETEFRKIIESGQGGQRLPRSSRSALESGAGRVQRTTGEINADSEQVERPEVREQNQSEVNVTPSLDMANTPAFREAPDSLATRNRLVDDLENAAIPQGEDVADITDQDLDAMSPDSKRLLKALRDDDWLGFDNIDDLLTTIFDEGLDGYETSIATRIALGRYVNQNYGGITTSLDMLAKGDLDNIPNDHKFNGEDATDIVKDLQYRLETLLPFYKGIMDQYVDMKQLERKIAANRGLERLPASESFYDSENLMHGKSAYELDLVTKNYLIPIQKVLASKNLDVEAFGKYLLAKHAPERNVVIAQKALEKREKLVAAAENAENQRMIQYFEETPIPFQDYETEQGGSGISSKEAVDILALAEFDGLSGTMEEAAQLVYDMLKEHRDRMVENQLLDFETVEDWEGQYQFYVPLKGFAAEEGIDAEYRMSDKTRGFSIVGSESLKAKGRTTLPANPLVIAILDVAAKIKRGEKNQVANVLLDMLQNSGFETDPEITEKDPRAPWTIYNNKYRPKENRTDGATMIPLDQMSKEKTVSGEPRFVVVKRGGQTFFIEFKDPELNKTIQRLGESPFNQYNLIVSRGAKYLSTFQNFRRNMLINYNPAWGLVNPIRDVVTAIPYAMSESQAKGSRTEGKGIVRKMVQNYPNALRAYWRHLRETEGRGKALTARGKARQAEYDQYVKEYFEDGAPTGMILTRTYDEEVAAIERQVKGGDVRGAFVAMGKFVEDFNQTMENAVRVSAYVEARKAGSPRENSATLAKDLTVNFNRKGESNAAINLAWLFFNAAQQGTLNFIQAVGRHGMKVPAFAAGMVAFGYATTVYNILMSPMDDDDGEFEEDDKFLDTQPSLIESFMDGDASQTKYADYSDYQLKRSISIMREDGSMVSLPMAYGWMFLPNLGRLMAEWQFEIKSEQEVVGQIGQTLIDNFSPVDTAAGEGVESLRGFAPDIGELWLDLVANKNYFGSPIQKEQTPFEAPKAKVHVTKRGTSKAAKDVLQYLNDLDGSKFDDNEYLPYNYLTPDRVDYVFAWTLGGVGRFVGDVSDVTYKAATDPDAIELVDFPIVGQFYKEPSAYTDQMNYYENRKDLQSKIAELEEATTPEKRENFKRRNLEPFVTRTMQEVYKASDKELRAIRKVQNFQEAHLTDDAKLRVEIERLDKLKQKIYDRFNKFYENAVKKSKEQAK
jgi:hypothetical protein